MRAVHRRPRAASPSRARRSATRLERLWALGLFSAIRVEEIPTPGGGVRLAYQLTRRPLVRTIHWEGKAGIDLADAAAVAGLAIGEEATPAALDRAERDLLARYRREGYLGATRRCIRARARAGQQRAGRHHPS